MSSCKKANAQTSASYSIQGLWIGTYTVDGQLNLGQQYFSFIIKPDGTMINDTKGANVQHLSPGTWALTGDTLSCTYTSVYGSPSNIGVTETSKAYFSKTGGTLSSGIWKNVAPLTGSGTFTLTRVN
ncbi:MAG: hypothetical protein ABJB86_17475 [Bacteroidota bacterium]